MIDKTFSFIFEHNNFKTLGAGRTDAKVSANQFPLQLLLNEAVDTAKLLEDLKKNLPPDIKVLSVELADPKFSVISESKNKQYQYFFYSGDTRYPFCAPFMVQFKGELDIEIMKKGASIFEGQHNFKNYCYKPSEHAQFVRTINKSIIKVNDKCHSSFFPKESWIFEVESSGFLRRQIRLMMGALVRLGQHELSLQDIIKSLDESVNCRESLIVPSSGLLLDKVDFY